MDNTREETPDLFRNSTLGMFELPNNSESEDSDDEEGEEIMFDDPYADDMEFDEGDIGDNDEVVSEDDEDMMDPELGDMGPIEGLPGDIEIEVEMPDDDGGMGSDDDSEDDSEDDEDEDDDDDMDDDGDDDEMDDDEAMEALEALEEVTGDDENASLGDDQEDDWSDDPGDFDAHGGGAGLPHGSLGLVLESPSQLLEQMHQSGEMEGFLDDDMAEEGMQKLQSMFDSC
jgi:E3 ubiquitin-protein ligase HUWE1